MQQRVLIVDDAMVDRERLQCIVAEAGCTVLLAASGAEALVQAKAARPDLILMDVNMPDMDGFAATRKLKADEATRDIPVVFVTGKNQKADMAWGQMLGARGYVTKPFTPEQILLQLGKAG